MRLTSRDERLIRDIALSHVLSRDQIIALGYFNSVTRANTRLRELIRCKYIAKLATPYFGQHLYGAGSQAAPVAGERIARLLSGRRPTPRFVQHALAVTASRIALDSKGYRDWRFEAQLRHEFLWCGEMREIRPDGMARFDGLPTLIEVDLGHVTPLKFARKLKTYEAFALSGELLEVWGDTSLSILVLSCGRLRCSRLKRFIPTDSPVAFQIATFDDLGISVAGGWS